VTTTLPPTEIDRQRNRQAPARRDHQAVRLLVQQDNIRDHAVTQYDEKRSPEEFAGHGGTEWNLWD
jgi:hypothetical protein